MVLIDGNAVGKWNRMLASLLREFRLDSVVPVGAGTICPSETYEVADGFTGSYAAVPVTLTVYHVFPRELWSANVLEMAMAVFFTLDLYARKA